MKQVSKIVICVFSLAQAIILGCTKEVKEEIVSSENITENRQPDEPGFASNEMVMYWNEKTETVLSAPMRQPDRTRYFAMIQIAVHDALNNIKPKYERFSLFERTQHANTDAAVASAAYWAIIGLNRQGSFPVDTWYQQSLNTISDGEAKTSGIELGKKAAASIIANRSNDGFTQLIVGSTIPANGVNPGEYRSTVTAVNYVPTNTLFPVRTVPNWGYIMRPYIIESNQQFQPVISPDPVNSNEYLQDYNEVKAKGARTGSTRTSEEDKIAAFWSESRPSIIWNRFATKAIANKRIDAWKTARLLALIHVGMAESVNTQLRSAYHYYYWRPETAVRTGATDGNDNTQGDATWLPYLSEQANAVSPPVPSYPNGFASFGAVTAETLRLFFGSDATSIDLTSTSLNPAAAQPITFHYSSFSEAAHQNALAMIYSGWDFRKSVLKGEEMGKQISNYVFTHGFQEQ